MIRSALRRLPFFGSLGHGVPPHFVGTTLENRLGLQIYRALGANVGRRLRPFRVSPATEPHLRTIERDGIVAIPDFLPAEAFAAVRREFEAIREGMTYRPIRGGEQGRLFESKYPVEAGDPRCTAMRQHVVENPVIREIASAVTRQPLDEAPSVSIDLYRARDLTAEDNDIEGLLHADTHYPTVKAWLFLGDIDEGNGAFVYAKGSHKLSLARLRHEYSISVNTARLKHGEPGIPADRIATRGEHRRIVLSEAEREAMQIRESQMCGGANTLVIANNMGFHRRGNFTTDRERAWLLVNFRSLERRR